METTEQAMMISLTSKVVEAYLARNTVPVTEVPNLINTVHQSLKSIGKPSEAVEASVDLKPAVPVKKSVHPEYIICLEDGKKLKMLKRHLKTSYNLTPDEYRAKWGLPSDYPMVAPTYAKQRSELAVKLGLGRRQEA